MHIKVLSSAYIAHYRDDAARLQHFLFYLQPWSDHVWFASVGERLSTYSNMRIFTLIIAAWLLGVVYGITDCAVCE